MTKEVWFEYTTVDGDKGWLAYSVPSSTPEDVSLFTAKFYDDAPRFYPWESFRKA